MKPTFYNNWLKFVLGLLFCLFIRMMPFRAANLEPLLATMMPYSKKYGLVGSFLFGPLSIFIFDLFKNEIGVWTLITSLSYGLLGVLSYFFLRNKKSNSFNYFIFSVVGTILYDVVTGLTVGMLLFKQTLLVTLYGQVPFTLVHLIGNTLMAIILSPLIYKYIVNNENVEISYIKVFLSKKRI